MKTFKAMLDDWTNEGFDPFAAPLETDAPFGAKHGNNDAAIERQRVSATRMVGLPGDTEVRTDASGYPINRMFADVPQDEPEVQAEPGFEGEVAAFNLFAYLSRSDVTWNPSVCSVLQRQPVLPDLRGVHPAGRPRQRSRRVVRPAVRRDRLGRQGRRHRRAARAGHVRAGDVAAMPADIRHQGYSTKRSMLLVWENGSPEIPELIREGKAPNVPVTF